MNFFVERVGILGVGLIGGSLGLALKRKKLAHQVIGLGRNPAKLQIAKERGAIDEFTLDWEDGVIGLDLLVIATPVCEIVPIMKRLLPKLKIGCIVTDVGSTKELIVRQMDNLFKKSKRQDAYFVGSHPMAGSEKSGVLAADENLFDGRVIVVTPSSSTYPPALQQIKSMWKAVGNEKTRVIELSPEMHDKYVAFISHLPHMIAFSLVNTVAKQAIKEPTITELVAGGFRDTTRIASSDAVMWRDICLENQKRILESIKKFKAQLGYLERLIQTKNQAKLTEFFKKAQEFRDSLFQNKQ